MKIESGKFVALLYELTGYEENPAETEEIEKTSPERPFGFIFGMGTVLPDFEKNLEGLAPGEKFDFTLTPAQGYGEYRDDLLFHLDRKMFCDRDGKFLSQYVKEGEQVTLNTQDGQTVQATVDEITDTEVVCDFNHPLAGMTLHFRGEVAEVREPNEDDKKAYMRESCGECEGGCHCKGDSCDGDCDCENKDQKGKGHHCCGKNK